MLITCSTSNPLSDAESLQLLQFCLFESKERAQAATDILRVYLFKEPNIETQLNCLLNTMEVMSEDVVVERKAMIFLRTINLVLECYINSRSSMGSREATLKRMARVHGLDSWVIKVRHDISHNHRLPSVELIDRACVKMIDFLRGICFEEPRSSRILPELPFEQPIKEFEAPFERPDLNCIYLQDHIELCDWMIWAISIGMTPKFFSKFEDPERAHVLVDRICFALIREPNRFRHGQRALIDFLIMIDERFSKFYSEKSMISWICMQILDSVVDLAESREQISEILISELLEYCAERSVLEPLEKYRHLKENRHPSTWMPKKSGVFSLVLNDDDEDEEDEEDCSMDWHVERPGARSLTALNQDQQQQRFSACSPQKLMLAKHIRLMKTDAECNYPFIPI